MNDDGLIHAAGDRVLCPGCKGVIAEIVHDIYIGDIIEASHVMATDGITQIVNEYGAFSGCCGKEYFVKGKFYTEEYTS